MSISPSDLVLDFVILWRLYIKHLLGTGKRYGIEIKNSLWSFFKSKNLMCFYLTFKVTGGHKGLNLGR